MLHADLTEFAFPAVLQMLLQGGCSGRVRVVGQREAEVWLRQGQVVQAGAMGRTGPQALELLGLINGGELNFEPGMDAPAPDLNTGRDSVLRQLMVDAGAWEPLLVIFSDWSMWPRFTPRWNPQQPVTRRQYRALSLVGTMSLEDMIRRSDLGARELLTLLEPFRQAGLIELVAPPNSSVTPR
ncbi:DUF4388 domain-containing protein [Deinococcus ruber]|uniref:Protein containing PATAN domain n=1 Tax=Deinococcus ruber TaxID=1848197 RepID=A0A918F0Z0_9DEIO|nr:DUF4388 domain-containing protein [Deinococcus ruber]GGQ95026.1 protein containing PATAN domain [Deinococcus ruber]